MSKIVKKKQLDVLIESTLKEAGVLTEGAVIDKIKEIIKQIGGSGKTFKEIFSVLKNNKVDSLEKAINLVKTNLGLKVDGNQVADIYSKLNEKLGLSLAESYSLQEDGFLKFASKSPMFRLLTLAMAIMIGVEISRQMKEETLVVKVEDKNITHDNDSKYLIFTDKEVFEETDEWLKGKFNSSDMYNQLKVGNTYRVKVIGFRIPFLSMYRNIIEVEEDVTPGGVTESVKEPKKEVLSEDFKRELEKFNKLTSFNYKY